jgi:hypothetical protein
MNNVLTKSGKVGAIFVCALLLVVSVSAQISLRTALDTDKDGKADFSVQRPTDNIWYIAKSGGGFTFQPFGSTSTDTQTPGDYDGDGKGDIAVWRETTGIWYILQSSTNTVSGVPFGTSGDEPVARDYDGDGKTDVAVVRYANGVITWYALRSSNGSLLAVQFGASTDFVAPGDYDGDKKFDLAVQRPGANPATDQAIFFILQSSNNTLLSIPWGFGNDLVVPGDYDGDGKTDIAVVREGPTDNSVLSWFIRKSTDGGLMSAAFGATGIDLNVQNDYDGDGKTDIAVWRDTNGFFYVLRSTDGGLTSAQWGAPSDIPIASYDTH